MVWRSQVMTVEAKPSEEAYKLFRRQNCRTQWWIGCGKYKAQEVKDMKQISDLLSWTDSGAIPCPGFGMGWQTRTQLAHAEFDVILSHLYFQGVYFLL